MNITMLHQTRLEDEQPGEQGQKGESREGPGRTESLDLHWPKNKKTHTVMNLTASWS